MWALFLTSWNSVKLFLPPSPLAMTPFPFSWMPLGPSGMVPTFQPHWFHGKWLPLHTPAFSPDISIAWQELFPIYLACALWGSLWFNKHIRFPCDNKAVVSIINTKTS